MSLILRYLLPISYFRATRLNRWSLVGYNGLTEWLPAVLLTLYYNSSHLSAVLTAGLSYLAFISLYEIGYITNDHLSEKFESEPRGRSDEVEMTSSTLVVLIGLRLGYFVGITVLIGALFSAIWWSFFIALSFNFALHNFLPSSMRISTFFGLSTFRFLAPIILTVPPVAIAILLPAILVNNSTYRTSVYLRNKQPESAETERSLVSKFAFYLGAFPISVFISVYMGSVLPVTVCVYFIGVWIIYSVLNSRVLRRSSES